MITATAVVATVVAAGVILRVSTYDEPVVRRGWVSLRSLSLTIAVAAVGVLLLLLIVQRTGRQRAHGTIDVDAA